MVGNPSLQVPRPKIRVKNGQVIQFQRWLNWNNQEVICSMDFVRLESNPNLFKFTLNYGDGGCSAEGTLTDIFERISLHPVHQDLLTQMAESTGIDQMTLAFSEFEMEMVA